MRGANVVYFVKKKTLSAASCIYECVCSHYLPVILCLRILKRNPVFCALFRHYACQRPSRDPSIYHGLWSIGVPFFSLNFARIQPIAHRNRDSRRAPKYSRIHHSLPILLNTGPKKKPNHFHDFFWFQQARTSATTYFAFVRFFVHYTFNNVVFFAFVSGFIRFNRWYADILFGTFLANHFECVERTKYITKRTKKKPVKFTLRNNIICMHQNNRTLNIGAIVKFTQTATK